RGNCAPTQTKGKPMASKPTAIKESGTTGSTAPAKLRLVDADIATPPASKLNGLKADRLTIAEQDRLTELENVIRDVHRRSLAEAEALLEIRQKRLYRASHTSFKQYCVDRLGISRQYANRLCGWAEVVEDLTPMGVTLPKNEREARPLHRLTPKNRVKAWKTIVGDPHANSVEQIAEVVQPSLRSVARASVMTEAKASPPRSTPRPMPLTWFGGKVQLAGTIVSLFPAHTTYVEPFFGSGAVFFWKPPSKIEWVNDRNAGVVNFFRVLRDPKDGRRLQDLLKKTPYARDEHEWCRSNPRHDDPVEEARRFFVRVRQAFNSRVDDSWAHSMRENRASTYANAIDSLHIFSERLRNAQIENVDFREILAKSDNHGTLLYLDPPYVHETRSRTTDYTHEMTEEDHVDLLTTVTAFRHAKVVLSGYASDLYARHLARWKSFPIEKAVNASHATGGNSRATATEMLWCNFTPKIEPREIKNDEEIAVLATIGETKTKEEQQ
ncbi:MAG: DNA adenine methylase, partial [Proteobacteria bacterium]|nr:DNA adenine methylase [Pseudomonadota bacterium]